MKTFVATALATVILTSFYIPAGEPGEAPKTYTIKDDVVYSSDGTPAEGAMQIIRGNAGEVTTASTIITFVVENDPVSIDENPIPSVETTSIDGALADESMQIIQGNAGEVATATTIVTFVKE